ncbi:MAG: encapsulin-associated ferritin-like protein [Pseudomonadota bacterium]
MTNGYHEPQDSLSERSRDFHRALSSLMEELEAVDWYQQRVDATSDTSLREILAHNRDEEIEHAAMVIEWLRRNHPKFDEQLRVYLFSTGSVVEQEEAHEAETGGGEGTPGDGSLGVGRLKATSKPLDDGEGGER